MKFKIIVLILFCSSVLKADWAQTNGAYGGSVSAIYSTNNKLFASSIYGSVYVSYDDGSTYERRNNGIMDIQITSFTSKGNIVFAAGGDNTGIFRTTDDGLNWISINSGLSSKNVSCLEANGSDIFAGTDSGMFKSSNSGTSWNQINNGLNNNQVTSITVTHNTIFIACSYYEVYKSSDNGSNWTLSFTGNNWNTLRSIDAYDSTIITGGTFTGLYRSTDLGQTWEQLNSLISSFIYSVAVKDSVYCVSSDMNLIISTDYGSSWTVQNTLPQNVSFNTIIFKDSYIFVSLRLQDRANKFYGIYKSSNNGVNWIPSSGNIISTYINTMYQKNGRVYSGSKYEGINYTSDGGNSWNEINNGLDYFYIYSIGSCDTFLFTGTYSKLGRSADYGENWSLTTPPNNIPFFTLFSNDSIILSLSNIPYKSTNYGASWFQSNSGYTGGYQGLGFAKTDNYLFAASENALFRTTDFGESWMKLLSHSGYAPITAIAENDNNLFLGIEYPDTGIIMSTDFGISFNSMNTGLINRNIQALYSVSGKVFAGTKGGVYVTNNNGASWSPLNSGLGTLNITSFSSDSIYLFAGTGGNGIWKLPLSEILTSVNNYASIPISFNLYQNYPNPFNPSSVIKFDIAKSGLVKLRVYDINGKIVEELVNENLNAGSYSYNFLAKNLSSGMYFYTLEANGFTETKKLMLIK